MLATPLRFIAIDVSADLRGPMGEPSRERGELFDLTGLGGEGVPVRGECAAEVGVAHDGGMPDPVDRPDRVHDPNRVQTPPPTVGEDASVEVEVEVTVRVPSAGGVVPHHRSFESFDGDLDLQAARADAGGGVRGEPADYLDRRAVGRRRRRPRSRGGGTRRGTRSWVR